MIKFPSMYFIILGYHFASLICMCILDKLNFKNNREWIVILLHKHIYNEALAVAKTPNDE